MQVQLQMQRTRDATVQTTFMVMVRHARHVLVMQHRPQDRIRQGVRVQVGIMVMVQHRVQYVRRMQRLQVQIAVHVSVMSDTMVMVRHVHDALLML